MLEITVGIICDHKVLSLSIVHKIKKELLAKRSFSINEFVSISCFKDFTPTFLQCYGSFRNFLIALINPIVHKIIPRITCKKLVFK